MWRIVTTGIAALSTAMVLAGAPSIAAESLVAPEAGWSDVPHSRESQAFYVLANTEFTLLHELGHALIHTLKLPVLGHEEDAADAIAIAGILISDKEKLEKNLLERLTAVSDEWLLEWKEEGNQTAYWDSHRLEIQRFYNTVCLIYGSDPIRFKDIAFGSALPADRALVCEDEFALARRSIEWTLSRYSKPMPFQHAAIMRPDSMVPVTYEQPGTPNGAWLQEILKRSGLIEKIAAQVNAAFVLPQKISIELVNCGEPDAYFHTRSNIVVLCWPLLERFLERAKRRDAAGPQSLCAAPIAPQLRPSRLGCPQAVRAR